MPRVSIIIPAYNSERFLEEALKSVLAQSFRDYEVIIVDDGSRDNTGVISSQFAASYPGRIRYVYQRNGGPGSARNHGMRLARGEYFAFLDADDAWLPGKLKKQVALLDRDPVPGMVYCNNYWFNRRGEINTARKKTLRYRGNITADLFNKYFIFPSGVLLRASCVSSIGGFRRDIFVGEDYDFFLRFSYCFPVEIIYERLFLKRTLKESLSNRDVMTNGRNDIDILTRFAREHPLFSGQYPALVAERLWEYNFNLAYYCVRRGRSLTAFRYSAASLKYRLSAKSVKCLVLSALPYPAVRFVKEHMFRQPFEVRQERSPELQ